MQNPEPSNFNQQLRDRTMNFAVRLKDHIKSSKIPLIDRSAISQLLRCSSSVAANTRSATRARSDAEFYSKICIVTEEIDETQFWLEYLTNTGTLSIEGTAWLRSESDHLVRLFTSIKKKMREKLKTP